MNALTLALAVPPWLALTGKIIAVCFAIFAFFVYCRMRSNAIEHEAKDDTIDPEDF
jgi:hypothetical protein